MSNPMPGRRNWRETLFWGLDYLSGSHISTEFSDVCTLMGLDHVTRSSQFVTGKLKSLLSHAKDTTAYYQNIDLEKGIHGAPVVDKNIIRNDAKSFLSTSFGEQQRIPAITSGSTGTPFRVYHDRQKKIRNYADTMYFAVQAGYQMGDKLYYLKIWSENNRKKKVVSWLQHIRPVDVLNIETHADQLLYEMSHERSPIGILGYVSAIESLLSVAARSANPLDIKVASIITMSETLSPEIKASAQHQFQCPVFSRYSNIENGIIAQETKQCPDFFIINEASYFVEVLDSHQDVPLNDGDIGRIVVTDLHNRAMPLIRYDTGDMGSIDCLDIGGKKQRVFRTLEGRRLDQIFNTAGQRISSYLVYRNMWKYLEIKQYQLIQETSHRYCLKISVDRGFRQEQCLVKEFQECLGSDADFRIEQVNDIPLLDSGKRKKVVNLMAGVA